VSAEPRRSEARDTYDALWRVAWGDMQNVGPVHRHIREDLLRVVASLRVQTILDVGCGGGDNLAALAATGRYDLAGADVSKEALAIAARRVPAARLSVLDVQREALPDRFDLVISMQVVEHLPDDATALVNMARMAGQWVFVSTMQGRMRPSEAAIGHVRNYTAAGLQAKMRAAGLEPVRVYGWGFPFYSPLYRTAVEWLPGGPPAGAVSGIGRVAAGALYHLYRLNVPGKGDVLSVLARRA
jgi:2-polyprenyl-3-methyl-5-hydroxy-6-metoxy-1,4-benzoquinol methylase